ncbi:MAG: DNA topoisomerase [Lachnospiraceae bacterium]|nr:DNA topoisomerase [Lachnospiraceae bacterium]
MGKKLIITEKPSVAREFAKALKEQMKSYTGYMESEGYIITWCVGHLVMLSYPEAYDESYRRWSLDTIPFIPQIYKYEVIDNVKKQFEIVKMLFHREDVDVIYNAGDSGREGEYIQRLVLQEAGYNKNAELRRIWIDSQTEEEILRGIKEAKDMSAYDNLSDAAYLRAKEDYLMGINFSRALTLKYGYPVKELLKLNKSVISVGRVMTCVQGMVVNREREIRNFEKTPFYKITAVFENGGSSEENICYAGEWKVTPESSFFESSKLYKESGFLKEEDAKRFLEELKQVTECKVACVERKKESKNPPLLYNLAELQNECSKLFKISPDETLKIAQELYEKKMTTYPRTDARVLSSAVAKEIKKNLSGLKNIAAMRPYVEEILADNPTGKLLKSRYVNDKQITDHYAIIPTGQGLNAFASLSAAAKKVYEIIVRRFLSIFYPAAIYRKTSLETKIGKESFFSNYKVLEEEGYLKVLNYSFKKQEKETAEGNSESEKLPDESLQDFLKNVKKNQLVNKKELAIKEGETSPPKRYNSGSIILAMENAGQLIEDEELREQIKGSGIGTSATRAEILKKLVSNGYLALNKKTQIITPTILGEMIYEVVKVSIRPLLDPKLTASWEKGLTQVAEGQITSQVYLEKLNDFVIRRTNYVKSQNAATMSLHQVFKNIQKYY